MTCDRKHATPGSANTAAACPTGILWGEPTPVLDGRQAGDNGRHHFCGRNA